MRCKKCNHTKRHHATPSGRMGTCKHEEWDFKQDIYMPCKCKGFALQDLEKET